MTQAEAKRRVCYWMYLAMLNSPDWLESLQSGDVTETDKGRIEQAWDEVKAYLLRRGGDPNLRTL